MVFFGSASNQFIIFGQYIVTISYSQSHWSFCFMTDLNNPSIELATHRFLRCTSCIERLDELWLVQKECMTRKTNMRRKHATKGIYIQRNTGKFSDLSKWAYGIWDKGHIHHLHMCKWKIHILLLSQISNVSCHCHNIQNNVQYISFGSIFF